MYLSDLSVLGAPQYSSADLQFTSAMDGILAERRSTAVPEKKSPCHLRDGPQCISGAGLIMSRNAVELLPPFTSFDENDLWVDDHIKRRLHEVLHHLDPQDDEVVGTAKAVQDRHPRGLNPGDFDWARDHYFDRLLRGCCLMSIISHPVEELTPYCSLLGEIVSFKVKVGDSRLSRSSQEKMFSWMTDAATQRYQEALRCWKDNKLAGTVLGDWASSLQESHRDKIIKQVRDDAWKYISLTLNWPAITRAVLQLTAQTNYWLYSEP
ncbi:hypothetical protein SBA4_440016 [Candidatus Sulfopaludibacter sp. SbA4]|nr:hypothetical protein SBA4_440016 [Candidatus Sulfopaludibacter sp. SbA4]